MFLTEACTLLGDEGKKRLRELSAHPEEAGAGLPLMCRFTDQFGRDWSLHYDSQAQVAVTLPRVTELELERYYGDDYYSHSTEFDPRSLNTRLRAALYHLPALRFLRNFVDVVLEKTSKEARILDFGCGNGARLRFLRHIGFQNLYGVELGRAWESDGIVVRPDLSDYDDASFDVIVASHVLEHVFDFDQVVREFRRVSADGAHLYAAVPNLRSKVHELVGSRWLMLDAPRHQWHFTADSLQAVIETHGFAVEHKYTKPVYPKNIDLRGLSRYGVILRAYAAWLRDRERSDAVTLVARKRS
jgi:SAM-dependent methyltransferase